MTLDTAPTLDALTALMKTTLESDDRRRFSIVHTLSRTAQQFVRAVSLRVEDLSDTKKPKNLFKIFGPDHTKLALVPETPSPSVTEVLSAMSHAMLQTLGGTHKTRFAEIERISNLSLDYILEMVALEKGSPKEQLRDDEEIGCDDPEGAYVRQGMVEAVAHQYAQRREARLVTGGAPDVNELRRDIISIESTDSQIRAELANSQIAAQEAQELQSMLHIVETVDDVEISDLADERISQLKARLALRTKGKDGLVSTDVSRGHSPGREGARDDGPERVQGHPHREEGPRVVAQAGAFAAVGNLTVVDA